MTRHDDLRAQRLGAGDGSVEVVDLEPEQDLVSWGQVVGIADAPVMVFFFPVMELQNRWPRKTSRS